VELLGFKKKEKKDINSKGFYKKLLRILKLRVVHNNIYLNMLNNYIISLNISLDLIMVEPDEIKGSFDSGDPNTTNLYLGNLNPKVMYKIYLIILI
jgi:hypothetical protein